MIPKIIHYCWFGKNRKPELVNKCIASWKQFLPDYKIIEWNEKNSNLNHPFVKEAYLNKKWPFVSDYVRIQKLYEYGGIYLDTDMLLVKSLNDFLKTNCFFGAENSSHISAGVIGAIPKNGFINKIKNHYEKMDYDTSKNLHIITMPIVITDIYREFFNYQFEFNKTIEKDGIAIFPSKYFYPLPYKKKDDHLNYEKYVDKNTYAIHLWNESWMEPAEFQYLKNLEYWKGFQIVFKRFIKEKGLERKYLKKVINSIFP